MEAIILAGGLGTRLRSMVSDVPKTMAPINDKPFLAYILEYLAHFGYDKIVLSVGYKKEVIQDYFQNNYRGMQIRYSCEEIPLGTGGAIKKALSLTHSSRVLVLNGDSFMQVNLQTFAQGVYQEPIVLCVKPMQNFDRFGSVIVKEGKVVSFEEKKMTQEGYINTGIYLIQRTIFDKNFETTFSFETFLHHQEAIGAFIADGYFIDIGIPEDYVKAQKDFKELF